MTVPSFHAMGLDAERAGLASELFELNSQVHDQAFGLVGPMPMPPDLTMQQVRVLGHVVKSPGITGNELGATLGVSAPTASGLVDRLVDKGLVTRVDDVVDRRIRRLHATRTGLELMRDMDSMFGRALGVVLQELSADDLRLLCSGSRAMLSALSRVSADQEPVG